MRRAAAIAGLVIGLAGLGIDFWMIVPVLMAPSEVNPEPRSFLDAFITFWTYFTHLSNLGLVLVYAAELTPWRGLGWFRKPQTRALMGGYLLFVMLYYLFMLAPYLEFEGPLLVATILLHYVAPLYYLGWWAMFAPHGVLRLRDVPPMLVPGLLYVAWALARGAVTGEYPYDMLDAGKYGYAQVATGVGVLLIFVAGFCTLIVSADKLFARVSTA